MWFCCSQNLKLCTTETENIEGTIFSMFSNLCTCEMSPRAWECSADEKPIIVQDECLKNSSMTFFNWRWVGPPGGQMAAPVVGQGVQEQWLTELDGGVI